MATIKATQTKSKNGSDNAQRATLASLGLRKIGHTVEVKDTPEIARDAAPRAAPHHDRGLGMASDDTTKSAIRPSASTT